MRQFAVNVIVLLWPVMTRRLKTWAFMNDGYVKNLLEEQEHDSD